MEFEFETGDVVVRTELTTEVDGTLLQAGDDLPLALKDGGNGLFIVRCRPMRSL